MKSKLKKYAHLLWALYFPCYGLAFFGVEQLVPSSADYWVSYMKIDEMIPFCEYFVTFYILWFPYMLAPTIYLALKDADAFRRLVWCMAIGFTSAIIFFLIFPNGQDLRPQTFPRDNIFTDMVAMLYASDTNTNVLPSMHVIGTMATVFAFFDSSYLKHKKLLIALSLLFALMVNLSTVLIKQHSLLDVIYGLVWSGASFVIVYLIIKPRMQKKAA